MYQAVLIVSFGGPETSEDVLPFLENVTRGRNVPRERLLAVAGHYHHLGGKSPINDQCRDLISALRAELEAHGMDLPIYWGNRNWRPYLADALNQMRDDGITSALAFMTSACSSYSGCRQYRENVTAAQLEAGPGTPTIDKLRAFYNHPGFIQASADRVRTALSSFPAAPHLVVTAHSIPCSMAETSDYEKQLGETARLVAHQTGLENWDLVYQSRSGPPSQSWLGPDILDHLRTLHQRGVRNVLLAPLGFLSDHMEVLYDLDTEARELAIALGMNLVRAATVGTHPAFVGMIRQLICERMNSAEPRLSIGFYPANHDVCPADCCPAPPRAGRPHVSEAPAVSPRP